MNLLIIAALLRHTRQPKLCDLLNLCPFSRYSALHNNHIQNITNFTIHRVSLQALRVTRHRKLRYSAPRILRLNMYRKLHHKFSQKFPLVGVSQVAICVSSQINEKVTREGSFTKGFRNVI
jgi:hypothetical protein